MTAHIAPRYLKAAALALAGAALLATTACAAASAATSGGSAESIGRQPNAVPVVVNCALKTQVRPGSIILGCADGKAYFSGLNWTAWGPSSALASGTYAFYGCVPNCVAGPFYTFPALVVLWGARALPGHAGVRYFTEMTAIFTGNRTGAGGGKTFQLSQTLTIPLSNLGGA
jgi:hypothetical protein